MVHADVLNSLKYLKDGRFLNAFLFYGRQAGLYHESILLPTVPVGLLIFTVIYGKRVYFAVAKGCNHLTSPILMQKMAASKYIYFFKVYEYCFLISKTMPKNLKSMPFLIY